MTKKFLQGAYEVQGPEQTRQLYRDWAATYDEELESQGYASPARTAQALKMCAADSSARLLDVGCGSGVSGVFLREAGFTQIHGADFSSEMLEEARKKDIYNQLYLADFSNPFDYVEDPYPLMAAVGVFTSGHADARVMSALIELMPMGGLFAFSLNDHSLKDAEYMDEVHQQIMQKQIRLRWQEYGEHLPGLGLQSMIVVVEKLN